MTQPDPEPYTPPIDNEAKLFKVQSILALVLGVPTVGYAAWAIAGSSTEALLILLFLGLTLIVGLILVLKAAYERRKRAKDLIGQDPIG
jgi:multisubunit Na+/H+ antiporter MnhG subunit